jgi:UDP-GlcNAc:undecaprenyl-phosphate GlcNAc-1-phosphate transferase
MAAALSFFGPLFFSGLAITAILTPLVLLAAKKNNIVDNPSPRKIHKESVPLLGGVAIYVSFLCMALVNRPLPREIWAILAGGTIVFIMGIIDDIRPLSSRLRLAGQLTASAIVMSVGLIVSFVPETFWWHMAGYAITTLWFLGIINAFNFIDGVDGLAAGIGIIASFFFCIIALTLKQGGVAFVSAALAGCVAGFIFYNFKPARIYLGDGGSTFIGFLLASIAIYGGWSSAGPVTALGIPVLILGLLIFDMCYITASRIRSGRVRNVRQWLDYTGKDHFHHRLLHMGFSERQTVLFIYIKCVILGLSAVVLATSGLKLFTVVILVAQAALMLMSVSVLMIRGRDITDNNGKSAADKTPHAEAVAPLEEEGVLAEETCVGAGAR